MSGKSYVSICYKYILFFVNFLIWLVALALMAVGAYVLVQKEKTVRDAMDFFLDPACFLTLAGSIGVGLTMLGCMGSLRENTCLISSYHYIATLFLLLQLVGAILLFVLFYVPNAQKTLNLYPEDTLTDAIIKYRDDADLEGLMNTIQKDLKCCGVSNDDEGYKDWDQNAYFHCNTSNPSQERCNVPASCCILKENEPPNLLCGSKSQSKSTTELNGVIFTRGCLKAIRQWIDDNAPLVGGIALGILVPQIYFIYLARQLHSQIKDQRIRYKRENPGRA